MFSFSYNFSQKLKETIEKIEDLNKRLVLTPFSFKEEILFRWKKETERGKSVFLLEGSKPNNDDLVNYRKALEKIRIDWLNSSGDISVKEILSIFKDIGEDKLRVSNKEISFGLEFIQAKPISEVVQAGLLHIFILNSSLFIKGNTRMAFLISYLFLYKKWIDPKGFLVLEDYFISKKGEYEEILEKTRETGNATIFLEFFAVGLKECLEKTIREAGKISKERAVFDNKSFDITERQKEILVILNEPGIRVNNRFVQKKFKVSQITASRDLAKLMFLGLILSHGRGRSIYYTKT